MTGFTPSVAAIFLNREGKVLLRREKGAAWQLPSAVLTGGYDWLHTLRGEMRESLGIEIGKQRLVGIYSDPSLHSVDTTESGRQQFLVASFLVTEYQGEIQSKGDECEWFAVDALPESILKSDPIKIQDVLSFKGESFIR